jgi:hypothetical protein
VSDPWRRERSRRRRRAFGTIIGSVVRPSGRARLSPRVSGWLLRPRARASETVTTEHTASESRDVLMDCLAMFDEAAQAEVVRR